MRLPFMNKWKRGNNIIHSQCQSLKGKGLIQKMETEFKTFFSIFSHNSTFSEDVHVPLNTLQRNVYLKFVS